MFYRYKNRSQKVVENSFDDKIKIFEYAWNYITYKNAYLNENYFQSIKENDRE